MVSATAAWHAILNAMAEFVVTNALKDSQPPFETQLEEGWDRKVDFGGTQHPVARG